MGGGLTHVDRPTGNPNIESGAGLFAQLVKEGGGHVGGPVKELEGVCRGGREDDVGYEMDTVGVQSELSHARWVPHSAGAHCWATCLRWEVLGPLASLSASDFRAGSAKKKSKRFMGGGKWRENERLIAPIPPSHNLVITNP